MPLAARLRRVWQSRSETLRERAKDGSAKQCCFSVLCVFLYMNPRGARKSSRPRTAARNFARKMRFRIANEVDRVTPRKFPGAPPPWTTRRYPPRPLQNVTNPGGTGMCKTPATSSVGARHASSASVDRLSRTTHASPLQQAAILQIRQSVSQPEWATTRVGAPTCVTRSRWHRCDNAELRCRFASGRRSSEFFIRVATI